MSVLAFDLLVKLLRRTGKMYEGEAYVASGGTTLTLICAALIQDDDVWNNGLVGITEAGAAAPEHELRDISDFSATADQVTVFTAFTAAPASGDKFIICRKVAGGRGSKAALLECLNNALRWYGKAPDEDVTLTTALNTLEYTLPASVDAASLFEVWTATRASAPYEWMLVDGWRVDFESRTLIFNDYPAYAYKLKLVSLQDGGSLISEASTVSDYYFADALLEYAFAELLRMYVPTLTATARTRVQEEMNFAYQLAEKLKSEHPLPSRLLKRQIKIWNPVVGPLDDSDFTDRIVH